MPPSRIVVAGGTGLLGRALSDSLADRGHDVVVLTRHASSATVDPANTSTTHAGVRLARWNPNGHPGPWVAFLDGAAAVVNLAGESIASGRWTATRKRRIRNSRVEATRTLVAGLGACRTPPPVFVSQSAVGYYGPRGDEQLAEDASPGSGFMAALCAEWETVARQGTAYSRVAVLRTGLVLDREGGALPRMLLPFKLFIGGPLGSGSQYVSWIAIDDWVTLTTAAINDTAFQGAINATAPNPVTNREFARTVGAVLGRPARMPTPAIAMKALLGELADALLLTGQRVIPGRALALGFRFRYVDLRPALESVLRRRQ